MANNTWSSAGSTDMNTVGNWSLGALAATDDLIWNNTSVINCAASGAINCNSITIASNYTGTWSISGQTATCAQGFSDDGTTGAHNYGNAITCNGASATFHVGSGVGTVTATSCALTMNGTTAMVIDDDKNITYLSLTLGASAIVTNSGAQLSGITGAGTLLTLGANSTLTINTAIVFTPTAAMTVFTIGAGVTLNGTAAISLRGATNGTITIPAMTYTGTGTITLRESAAGNTPTIALGGALSCAGLTINRAGITNLTTFSTGNNSITCTALNIGAVANGTLEVNLGSSTITCASLATTTSNVGITTINASSSQWTISGDFDLGTNTTWTASTEVLTFNSTTAVTAIFAGETVYDIIISKTGGGFTFSDGCSCHDLTVAAANNQALSWTGQVITASGDIEIDGTGTLNMGNGVTMNGASGVLHIGNTVGAVTASSCDLAMNGTTGMTLDDDKALFLKKMTLGANAVVTTSGAVGTTLSQSASLLIFTNGGTLTLNQQLSLTMTGSADAYTITAGSPTINGNSIMNIRSNGAGLTVGLPAITMTGTTTLNIRHGTAYTTTFNQSGTISVVTLQLTTTSTGTTIYNTVNNALTVSGSFSFGAASVGSTFNGNFGSSIVTVGSANTTTYNTGTITINASTSQWTISGDFDLGTNTTWVPTGETINFTGATACTLTSAGEQFYNLVVNKTALGVTLSDGCWCNNFTVTAGTFSSAGFSMTLTGSGSWGGTGALTLSGVMTFTGSPTSATISTSGVKTTAASTWVFQGAVHTVDLCNDAAITINDLVTKTAAQTITFVPRGAAKLLTITIYVLNDWGSAVNAVKWRSFVPGVRAYIAAAAGITVVGMDVQDNDNSAGALIGIGAGCTNSGNNVNWDFPPSAHNLTTRSTYW